MRRLLIAEPFFTGSHAAWAGSLAAGLEGFQTDLLTLEGRYWKWRMHGGAVTLAERCNSSGRNYDAVLATDMMDLALFKSLLKNSPVGKFFMYFHENQLCYPWSPDDPDTSNSRDENYAFINYSSALAADRCFFNSEYHRSGFIEMLRLFLSKFPDHNNLSTVEKIELKSEVLHLGLDLKRFDAAETLRTGYDGVLNILWNHRWEYDKNPELFYRMLVSLEEKGVRFRLVLLGEQFRKQPSVLEKIRSEFGSKMLFDGYAESSADYAAWLKKSHVIPVTNIQDFFGISVMEAVYCGVIPLLPSRLAYPELYGMTENGRFFYSTFEELVDRMCDVSVNYGNYRPDRLQARAACFDWTVMSSVYREKLENALAPA